MKDIKLPELGEGINEAEISDILVEIGDEIKVDDPIIVLETEKASMEIPCTDNGFIKEILINKGDTISNGDIILRIDSISDNTKKDTSEINTPEITHSNPKAIIEESDQKSSVNDTQNLSNDQIIGKPTLASPSIRKFSRELGCDLEEIIGTGSKGRITKEDILNHVKKNLNNENKQIKAEPLINQKNHLDFSKWGAIKTQSLNKIKKITGDRLQNAWQQIPHVTQFDKCDITELNNIKIKLKNINEDPKIKVSFIPFFIKAISKILTEMPQFNSSLDEINNQLILKEYINIGIAVNTQNGLIVPVIKNVNNKTIKQLSKELTSLSNRARKKQLSPLDMEGGCFTISSLGGIGGTYFTPIINPPEVAIIGISKSIYEPIFIENKLKKRLMLPFSLSYDHRVIDGADAAQFTNRFSNIISNLDEII